jgi:hypothetical protein
MKISEREKQIIKKAVFNSIRKLCPICKEVSMEHKRYIKIGCCKKCELKRNKGVERTLINLGFFEEQIK